MMHTFQPGFRALLREAATEGNPGTTTETPPPAAAEAPAASDLSAIIPDAYKGEDGAYDTERFRSDFDTFAGRVAEADERAAAIPETADAYDLTPGEIDFGEIAVPEWFKFELDPENPALPELRNWLHEQRLPPEAAQGLVGVYARMEAQRAAKLEADRKKEIAKLGPQSESRLANVKRWLETRIPTQEHRAALLGAMATADGVRALEALQKSLGAAPTRAPQAASDLMSITDPAKRLVEIARRQAQQR